MIKICYIIGQLTIGGAEKQLYELVKGINREKFQPFVISLSEGGYWSKEIQQLGIQVIEMNRKKNIELARLYKLIKLLKMIKPEIVHTYLFPANSYGRIASILTGVPIIISSVRNISEMGKDKNLYEIFIDRFLALFSQGIICNSYKAANNLRKYNFNKKNIFTIHNGINVGDFLSERNCGSENNLIPDTSSSRIVGTIGRLCPQKNHRLFLEAAQIVTTKFMSKTTPPHPCLLPQGERGSIISPPLRGGDKGEGDACGFTNDRSSIKKSKNENLTFLIVGGGTLTPELENYSKNLGIEKYVVFTGERSDIPDLLRRMDIFVMTSFYEGLSNTIMEAMLAGLPVVATDVGGNNELVINGETGFLCPSNDAVAVADKILRLLENTQKAKQMGENGKNRIISEFKIEKMVEETETVYTTLIKQFLKSEKLVMELR